MMRLTSFGNGDAFGIFDQGVDGVLVTVLPVP